MPACKEHVIEGGYEYTLVREDSPRRPTGPRRCTYKKRLHLRKSNSVRPIAMPKPASVLPHGSGVGAGAGAHRSATPKPSMPASSREPFTRRRSRSPPRATTRRHGMPNIISPITGMPLPPGVGYQYSALRRVAQQEDVPLSKPIVIRRQSSTTGRR